MCNTPEAFLLAIIKAINTTVNLHFMKKIQSVPYREHDKLSLE